jgi:hypothetical protein
MILIEIWIWEHDCNDLLEINLVSLSISCQTTSISSWFRTPSGYTPDTHTHTHTYSELYRPQNLTTPGTVLRCLNVKTVRNERCTTIASGFHVNV